MSMKALSDKLLRSSAVRILLAMSGSIFVAEAVVMVLIDLLPPLPLWGLVLLDSTAVLVALFPILLVLVLRPLTDQIARRERADTGRRRIEAEIRATLDSTADGILAVDDQGKILHSNQRFADLWRIPAPLIEAGDDRAVMEFVLDQLVDPQSFVAKVQSLADSDSEDSDRIHFKDGRIFERVSVPMRLDGTRIGRVWSFSDVGQHMHAVESLLEQERQYRLLFDAHPEPMWVYDRETLRFLAVNTAAVRHYGWSREEFQAMTIADIRPPEDQPILRGFVDKIANDLSESGAWRHLLRDGRIIFVEIGSHPLRFQGRDARLVVARDVTARLQAERDKKALEQQLQQSQKLESVGLLAGGVAHDFNNMLGVILGTSEVALEQVDPAEPLYADLQEIRKAAERSALLTRQLLAFARQQTVAPRALDLNATVSEMVVLLRRLIGEDILLDWQPAAELWPITIDPSQVDLIVSNLCVNARAAIAGVGTVMLGTANCTIDPAFCATHPDAVPGDYVRLAIRDSGCGMDERTMGRIFEPFFTTKAPGEGTGLGLASVYGAVRQNGGFITVVSSPGEGATFEIYLPRRTEPEAPAPREREGVVVRGERETVLLVEDEPSLLALTRRVLESQGYVVLATDSPTEAVRIAGEHPADIDLLLTDVVMPVMNGRDLAAAIVEHRPSVKHLFMSAYTADVIASRGMLAAGVPLLQKPFTIDALATKVRDVLDGA